MTTKGRGKVGPSDIKRWIAAAPGNKEFEANLAKAQGRLQMALALQKAAEKSAVELMEAVEQMLRPITYGHGPAPDDPEATEDEILASKKVATQEDQATKEASEHALALLAVLDELETTTKATADRIFERMMTSAMHVAVSRLDRGHIRDTARRIRPTHQTLRAWVERRENYPGFSKTAAPTVTKTRWGPRLGHGTPNEPAGTTEDH